MVTYSGSLVQSCRGEGRTLQANITGRRGSARSVSATLACPCSRPVCFPVYTAQAPGCSAGGLSKAGPGSHALPRSKLLRFRFSGTPQRRRLNWARVLCPSQVGAAQVTRCLGSALSPVVWYVPSPPRSQPLGFLGAQRERRLSCALCLLWRLDLWLRPSWWMSNVQDPRKTWLATGRLLTVS